MTVTINGTTGIANDGGYTGDGVVFADTTPANTLVTTTGGNVGIGTSSPGSNRLYINAPDGTAPLTLNSAGGSDTTRALNFNVAGDNYGKILVPSGSGGAMAFWTGGANAAVEQARITSAGLFQFNSGYGSVATAYGCRAWVNFNGTGTVAIRASGNVSSITDNGTGDYTVNFTTAMPDANYALQGTCLLNNNTDGRGFVSSPTIVGGFAPATGSARIASVAAGVGNQDFAFINVSIFR